MIPHRAYGVASLLLLLALMVVGAPAASADYSNAGPYGQTGLDFVLHGPVVGASFRW